MIQPSTEKTLLQYSDLDSASEIVARQLKVYSCEYPTRKKSNLFASRARDVPCRAVARVATKVRVFAKDERGQTVEVEVTSPLCLLHASLEAVKKAIEEARVAELRFIALKKAEEELLEKQITDQLIALESREAQEQMVAALTQGFAGFLPEGQIVDRRLYPNAAEISENEKLGIPAPKSFLAI